MGKCVFLQSTNVAKWMGMIRFLGNIEARTDAKGRVFIPAQFRKQLQSLAEGALVMRKDVYQDCLVLYPERVWNDELDELRSRLNKWNARHQQIFRQYVSDVELLLPDSSGRILLPKRYLQLAEIKNEVKFIGVDNRIEIWAKEKTETPFVDPCELEKELGEIMRPDVPGVD